MTGKYVNISARLFSWLLLAYPTHFRRKFGEQMVQTFRDCYRVEARTRTLPRFWLRTLLDLIVTAARERIDDSEREGVFMNNTRRDATAMFASAGIIVIAALLLSYGRRNEVSAIVTFGYVLDALIFTGVAGNLIVFVLAKTTRLDRLRTALWTFAVVHAVPLLFLVLIAGRNDPRFNLGRIVVGYVVSFLFWTTLHWAWQKTSGVGTSPEQV